MLLTALPAPAAQATWSRPFLFAEPGTLDAAPPQLAFSSTGASAAAFGLSDVDTPGSQHAWLTTRSAGGRVAGPSRIGGAAQILALSYTGATLQLLVGSSPATLDCCSTAQAVAVHTGSGAPRPGRPRVLVGGLAGQTTGRLLTLGGGRMLAVVATERGVWVSQSARGDRFGPGHLISSRGQEPEAMDAASLGGESSTVAWTAGTGLLAASDPRTIYVSTGSRSGPPRRAHVALTVAPGHRVDELSVARRGSGRTLVWIESWYDRAGAYHSQVRTADITGRPRARSLSGSTRLVSGLTAAADSAGDQGVAWQSCTADAACTVQAVGRPARGRFGSVRTLGGVDATEPPSLAISPTGQIVIGWVRGGHPVASVGFGAPSVLSPTRYATAIDVAYGPRRVALAAWVGNTLHPQIAGAAYSAR